MQKLSISGALFALALVAAPPKQKPLDTAAEVDNLSASVAKQKLPVLLRGTVTQYIPEWGGASFEDGTGAIYVMGRPFQDRRFRPGEEIEVRGYTAPGNYAPVVIASDVKANGIGPLPQPFRADWKFLSSGACDNTYVAVTGIVRSIVSVKPPRWLWHASAIHIDLGGNELWAYARDPAQMPSDALPGASVQVRGTCFLIANGRNRFEAAALLVPDAPEQVHVLRPASQNEAIPLTPIDRIFLFRSGADHQPRVRISGTVISANGSRVFIENGNTGVLVRTVDTAPVSPGDRVDAVGFPTAGGYSAEMDDAVLLPFGKGAGITPLQTTAGDLVARFRKPKPFLPDSMLIQLTATFLGASRSASGEVFTFKDGSTIFTASLQEAGARLRKIAEGSRLAVTGVCVIHADSFLLPQSFDLLLRSPADLQVLDEPSWLTRRLAMRAAGVLLGIALIALCAVMILGHRVGTQKTVIEEQKERERQLAERLRDLVENANDLVYILDLRGRILHVNSGAERVTGHSREEQLRMNITDLLVPEERELFRRELAARTSANGGYNFEPSEWCFLQKNGKTTCVELNLRIVAHAGDDVRIEAIGRDVTARKQALVDNEERFRTLANNIPQLTWMADETGSIFWCNERWFQYTGATLQESRGRGWEKWHHPEHLDRVRARLELCLQSGDDWEDTFPLRGRNGQFQWFLGRAVAIRNESGQVTRWFGTTTNISEQKRMEDHLKRSNDNLREFAYIASHDLQEPLRNVTLFAEMLAGTFKGGDATPQRATYLDVVTGGARRMKSLIADLLAYSTASGSDASDLSSIGFSSVIETAIQNLRTVIDESHARIVYGEMPSVRANSVHMAQVMQNLIANAIKYRRDGVPPVIKIRAEKKVDRWVFAVEDNGSGFKPEYGDRIFGIFKRLHGQDVPGTGIGLAICRALIERHGGKIWAEGRPGSGATFWFTIPD